MPDTQQGSKLHMVRGILEAMIVAALLWTGSSLIAVREQNAVMQNQLATIQGQLIDLPSVKLEIARHGIKIEQLEKAQEESRQVKRLR